MTTHPRPPDETIPAEQLRGLCGGAVHLAGDPGYDAARLPWNAAVDQRPAAVAYPGSADEVAEVVRAARRAGLRVAPQGTGHNARALGPLDDVVLLRTAAMCGVQVDPVKRTARVEAGVLWQDAVEAAAEHGLAALHGSSPDVGVVGYSLGGGVGWYARMLGLQANHVTSIELVTADGALVRADQSHESDLFWALRGGSGSFGVVTALEFALHDVGRPFAGVMVWDASRAPEVLDRWARWAGCTPDEATTALRIFTVPALSEAPPALRGRTVVTVGGVVVGDHDDAVAIMSPLRDLAPEVDTFAPLEPAAVTRLQMDPQRPTPLVSRSAMLHELPPEGIEALLAAAGPGSGSSLLVAELRQLGGALDRSHPGAGALPRLTGQFSFCCGARAGDARSAARGSADVDNTIGALSPWATDPADYLEPEAADRLLAIRTAVDPGGLFHANREVRSGQGGATELPRQR